MGLILVLYFEYEDLELSVGAYNAAYAAVSSSVSGIIFHPGTPCMLSAL